MYKDYFLNCKSGNQETKLKLSENLAFPSWECLDGADVWGTPYKGNTLSGNLTSGYVQLSIGVTLEDVKNLKVGSVGTGNRIDTNDGTFPEGEFSWVCESIN